MPTRLDFFVKLMRQSRTIMLSLGIKYLMRDLICDVDIVRMTRKDAICVIIT